VAWAIAVMLTVGLAALSRGEWRAHREVQASLRLTWSARPERIESCHRLSESELEKLPAHMRQQVTCEGVSATYRLRVWRGDSLLDDRVLHGSGLRRDRPMHVLRDYEVPPGTHRLRVEVHRIETPAADSDADVADTGSSLDRGVREAEERQRRRLEAIPAELRLDEEVIVAPREVVLVTWDADARRLRTVRSPRNPTRGGER
jgi:hypothetical protein